MSLETSEIGKQKCDMENEHFGLGDHGAKRWSSFRRHSDPVRFADLGAPGTIVVIHHTDCGMIHFHDADIRKALLEIATHEKEFIGASEFGEIKNRKEKAVNAA
ncbi:hypothetical protein N7510_006598 [Penicillium lagena]|uniref:uncharacterized protein n=1 Tax=Penicillium lagena TaxID=94218 RepID=UPI002540B82F|nr:uncharacterized protein N7510_006598 [Penicillium lagena]KAJ5613404.1 hypothetical protein N7510_006598 [Penicillium lagena]